MSTIAGIDIAKHTFDIDMFQANGKQRTKAQPAKDPKGFDALLQWLGKRYLPRSLDRIVI